MIGIIIFAVGLVIGYGVIGMEKSMVHSPPDTWSEIIGKLTGK
ncbi:MAG: DNA-directed RNA polymerase subunit beta [Streptococcus sp.]